MLTTTWWATPWPIATSARQGMFEVADAIMSPEELYRRTGIQRQPFNTIYQFLALQRENPEQLEAAETRSL